MIFHLVALKLMSFATSWGIMEYQPMVVLVAHQGITMHTMYHSFYKYNFGGVKFCMQIWQIIKIS